MSDNNESWAAPAHPTPAARHSTYDRRKNALLFVATVVTVFAAGAMMTESYQATGELSFWSGWPFAVPLLGILLFHEFGHYIAARIHRVPASLPYFIPLPPQIALFGTMGAVIIMPERIRSRNALLDIGAAGPLAGMVVAIPTMIVGLLLSKVAPQSAGSYIQEGQSVLYWLLKRAVVGPIPEGHDVFLHPTALAAWVGFFLTMINLLPWGQLDGGHIAYALLGDRHHAIARWVRRLLLVLFAYNLVTFLAPVLLHRSAMPVALAIGNSLFWLVWFGFTFVMGRYLGGFEHPPCEPGALSPRRKWVAALSLGLFFLLFMPTPLAQY